ncbi:hypothetical protein BJY24_007642 [Nocardia transvalensis]|uniref:Uncharacterized protein n=1 Tax=Nocardia transvalensis TaxID=37333 RepID=A0A7W9PML6_9NOCA|nr:hypothetical protein [Nocardia transvalensis]MBB5918730.1 hypothetical protein [Nocardia transvalensis]
MSGNHRTKKIVAGTVLAGLLVAGPVTLASQGAFAGSGGSRGHSSSHDNGRGGYGNYGGFRDRDRGSNNAPDNSNRRVEDQDGSVAAQRDPDSRYSSRYQEANNFGPHGNH